MNKQCKIITSLICCIFLIGIAIWAIRFFTLSVFYFYDVSNSASLKNFTCREIPGFKRSSSTGLKYLYGAEDLQINYENNLAFSIIGFRSKEFSKGFYKKHDSITRPDYFQGIYVYDLSDLTKNPIKIKIPDSNPQGIDLYKLNSTHIRVFVSSHVRPFDNNSGQEEVIYFDYDTKSNIAKINYEFFRIVYVKDRIPSTSNPLDEARGSQKIWATNDLFAVKPNAFLATQSYWFPFGDALKNKILLYLGLVDIASMSYVEFDEVNSGSIIREDTILSGLSMVTGLHYDFDRKLLMIAESAKSRVKVYYWDMDSPSKSLPNMQTNAPKLQQTINLGKGFLPNKFSLNKAKDFLYISGFNNGFATVSNENGTIPSLVMKMDYNNFDVYEIFDDRNGEYSGSVFSEISDGKYLLGSPLKNVQVCAEK